MDHGENNPNEEQDKLRFENELKKMKLSLEKGAVFSNPGNHEKVFPEIENEFLKHIEAFEKAYENAEQISVYNFIGRPAYRKADTIPDAEIGDALERIMNILNDNEVAMDTLCEVDDRVLYTFITEELFFHEMDNMQIEGMVHHYIYEEFHPNHEYDIRNHSADFMNSFLDKSTDFYTTFITKEAEKDKKLIHFRSSYDSFSLNRFSIESLTFDEAKAEVVFESDFSATIHHDQITQRYSGKGTMELLYHYDFWCVHKVTFPPVVNE